MHVRGFIALAASMLALAACGGGDDEGSSGAPGTTQETKPATTQEAEPTPTVAVRAGFPLRLGRKGPRVERLQRALAALGYRPGEPDGIYGELTRRAVIAFQRRADLAADGVVGLQTARAINRALARQSD